MTVSRTHEHTGHFRAGGPQWICSVTALTNRSTAEKGVFGNYGRAEVEVDTQGPKSTSQP
jgi:hypothetical protein